jgi:NADH-quinone oxidoreductase subunit C
LQNRKLVDFPQKLFRASSSNNESSLISRRYTVVYHLLSIKLNIRIRVKVFLSEHNPTLQTVVNIWETANWYEREAFDMFGIIFFGHPDLRRIFTDYGFIGHPLKKDFPQNGYVEMHYDEVLCRVVYSPVNVASRMNSPKVIRKDNRYYSLVK